MEFAGDSRLMLANGKLITLNSTFVSEGTLPKGSTWQMNPLPGYVIETGTPDNPGWKYCDKPGKGCRWFDPPCEDNSGLEHVPPHLSQGLCSGEWLNNVTTYDSLKVPQRQREP